MTGFINALGFLTIIKIPGKSIQKTEEFANSTIYFPLVGIMMGLVMALIYYGASFVFPIFFVVILTILFEIFLSGGAHLDGLADMFDGVFSGRSSREMILKIMKKSDIGVFGVLSIIFLLLLKITFLYYLASINSGSKLYFYLIIIFMPAFGRWSMVNLMARYKNARGRGSLAETFMSSRSRRKNLYISSAYLAILFFASQMISGYFWGIGTTGPGLLPDLEGVYLVLALMAKSLAILIILYMIMLPVSWFFTRRIGGITGDIIGGTGEITELAYLMVSFLILRFI